MYSLRQIRKGISMGLDSPSYFGRELNRLYYRRLGGRSCNTSGARIMDEDWDTLVILDACRYDTFASRHRLPGRLEERESRGSHTVEFLEGNFANGRFEDTVYVTATPQLYRKRDRLHAGFHSVRHVWREENWNDEYGTVLPETMTEHALNVHEAYPNKRIIVHYLQPHDPFIDSAPELNPRRFGVDEGGPDIWGHLMRDDIDVEPDRVRRAYEHNLDLVLDALEPLLSTVQGKIIVTSDHGNMFGERARPVPVREWGHPPGIYTEQLVRVPWLVYESGPRRTIEDDDAESTGADVGSEAVDDRLRDLGYVS